MLQFNKSLPTNTNAVYLETVATGSGYYDSLVAVFSQSYDESNGTFRLDTVSSPTQYKNWLVFSNTGSLVPSPSGQYNVDIYTNEFSAAVWNQVATPWDSFNEIWDTAGDEVPTTFLYSDRAFISGSNNVGITQYLSPNENGTYTTYNG
tara:strand:- start:2695 stop:3141 length:447 start_codon:yes stop_codon:yes gene_type:complete